MTQEAGIRERASRRDWVGLAVVLCAAFLGQIDMFIVNVALPSIQHQLGIGFGQSQLVVAAYLLAYASGLITGARIGDRFGRRRTFLWGVAAFTVFSLLCGLAQGPALLIAGRVLQGLSAAVLFPQVLAIVRATFLDPDERGRAVGAYGMVIGLGVVCGLAAGGLLVHADIAGLGWRTVFLVNVPVGVLILLVGQRAIVDSRSSEEVRFDVGGALLTLVAIPALLVPVIFGPRAGGAWWVWTSVVVAVLALAALWRQQRYRRGNGGDPLFPPHVVVRPGFRVCLIAMVAFYSGNSGLFLVFTYYLQDGLRLDALRAGLLFVPLGVCFTVGSWLSQRFRARHGMRVAIVGSAVLASTQLGEAGLVQLPEAHQPVLLALLIGVSGLGQGLVMPALVTAILSKVSPDEAGAASGIASTATQFAFSLGVAVIGTCYQLVLRTTSSEGTAGLSGHPTAFGASALVMAGLAGVTCLLSWLLRGRED